MSDYYSGHRGGYSSSFDTFSTWKNNCGSLFNPNKIDGSWLENGDYDRAFKGFPSHKQVNIFLGGAYQETSWKSTLLTGGVAFGIQALSLWALGGLFGGRKKAQAQAANLNNGNMPFWTNYFANWKMPSLTTTTSTAATQGDAAADPKKGKAKPADNDGAKPAAGKPAASGDGVRTEGAKPVKQDDNVKEMANPVALATNSNYSSNKPIKGDVKNVVYDSTNKGYPISYEIHDSSLNTSQKKDASGNLLVDIYYMELVDGQPSGDKKPKYKCVGAKLYAKNATDLKFNDNTYEMNSGFKEDKNGKYLIVSQLEMTTDGRFSTVQNMKNINYVDGTQQSYGKVPTQS